MPMELLYDTFDLIIKSSIIDVGDIDLYTHCKTNNKTDKQLNN